MKFITDENVDHALVSCLRQLGHDVLSASETLASLPDHVLLEHANQDERILITSDKDFGELVYRNKSIHHGILLLRLAELNPDSVAQVVCEFINEHQADLPKKFCVFSPGHVRMRPMKE